MTHQYPLVISKNAFPDNDFTTEVKFQYTKVSSWGTGFALSEGAPTNGSGNIYTLLSFQIWQDMSAGTYMRITYNGQNIYTTSTPILSAHTIKVDRIAPKYLVYLDGTLIFTSPDTSVQTKYIWLGNPIYLNGFVPIWTAFNIDYIRVKQLTPAKTPVIFIPGIGGSELKSKDTNLWSNPDGHGGTYSHTYPAGEKVWVNEGEAMNPGNDDYFDILKLNSDGQTSIADLELTGNIYAGSYQGALDFLIANGYVLNQDLFIFPYDWRKDVALTAPLLDQKIESIKTQTGTTKVDLVAHSLGGLVARNYISDASKASKVRKLITLGTPHLGAVDFLKNLKYGGCIRFETGPFCLTINPSEMKDVLQNMVGGLELAPTQKYYEFYSGEDELHPFPFRDDSDIDNDNITGPLNYDQTKTLLTNLGHNTPLFTPTEAFHSLDNNLANTNGVEVSIIAGSGIDTLGQIIEKNMVNFAGIKIPHKDMLKINGDETVPLLSASLSDPHKNLSLKGNAVVYYTKQKHSQLVFAGPAMNMVNTILQSSNLLAPGIALEPYKLDGHEFSVHSPVLIHAYDQNGKHTGPLPNGDYEISIPGSSYDTLEDAKFIFLPNDGIYTFKFEATDQGSFDFKIRSYSNDVNDKTILYKDVPLTLNTKAETVFDTNSSTPPILQIDADGNGTTDSQVNVTSTLTGDADYDQTAPQTTIKLTGTLGNNNWYKSDVVVELNATDEINGSGILKTEYSLDNGQTIQTYTNPFIISAEAINKLKVKSTDRAGNEENPQEIEIKIDKTSPEAKISFNISNQSLEIMGTDNLTNVSEVESTNSEIFTDEAGNTTKLRFNTGESDNNEDDEREHNEEKENNKEKRQENKKRNRLELRDISYNSNPAIRFSENEFKVQFNLDKKTNQTKEFKQDINIKKQIEINTNYDPRKNKTKLEIEQKDSKKQKLEKEGIIFLELLTKQGVLEVKY